MLAKMHFIISVAATLNCIPERVVKNTYCTDSDTLRKGGKNADAVMKGKTNNIYLEQTSRNEFGWIHWSL